MMWPTTKTEFQAKYPNLYRWSMGDHDLGRFRYSDTDAFDLFIDRVLNGNIVYNYTYKNVGRQHYDILFFNVTPFFNNSLVKDVRLPSTYFQASNHIYVHPKFIEEVNFQSSAFKWVSTPTFRGFRNENLDFFSKYLDAAAKNPNQFTTGRKISDFFSNIFTGPDKIYSPDSLTSALIIDKAYFQAIKQSTKNSPFSHVTLSEFIYLLSSFDNKDRFSNPTLINNSFSYQDVLKLNYLFSTRQFETYSREDFKLKPVRLWYELQFKRYLLYFYEQYYFSYLSPKNKYISLRKNFRIRRRRPYRIFDSNSQNATFFYPSFSFPHKDSFDFNYSTYYPYTNAKSYFSPEISTLFSRNLTLLKNPSLSVNNSFSNLFYTRFSDMYNSAWDFRAQTFTDSHKIYPSFSSSKTENFRSNVPVDRSLFSDLNFENDDLDRLFMNAYFNKQDSSNLIYQTLSSYPEKDLSIAHFYKKFNFDNSDFLPVAFYANQTSSQFSSFPLFFQDSSIIQPGVISNKKYKTFASYQNLRRFQNPFESINSRPYLRSLFQPSPRYRKFFHHNRKNFNIKNARPFARRRNSILQDSKTFPAKQSDIYFYFFDPSNSFNKEYSTFYLNNTKTFKLISNPFLDSIYVRRNLPFRIKYKYSDKQKRDYFFNSHIKPRVPLRAPRNKVFPTYRYSHSQKRLKYKQRPPTSYQDNFPRDDLELSDTILINYFTEKIIFMFVDIIPELFNTFFVKPLTNALHIVLKSDNFFSVLVLSFTFYLLDYAAVIIYIYFPGGLAFFDYTLFNYSFHNAYFSIFILSIFGLLFGAFQIWTTANLQLSLIKLVSLVAFNLFLEISILLFIIFVITFTYVSANFINFIFLFSTAFFFFLHMVNFFFQFFIQFSRYQYVPSSYFFFPFPNLDQIFGYYKINFFFSNWPKRFNFFFQNFRFHNYEISFQKSFFFIKVGNISTTPYRRLIPNTSYSLYHLSFPIPTYGPNVFEFYSYYYDLISKTSTQKYTLPSDDAELVEQLYELNEEQESSDNLDTEGEMLDSYEKIQIEKNAHLSNPINSDENDDWEDTDLDANLIDDDTEIRTKEDFKLSGQQKTKNTDSPSLKNYMSYKLVKNNKKFKGKVISSINTPTLDASDPTQAFFDERLEDIEFDAFDEQFTSESSIGFWYPFQLSRSSHRILPPPVFNLHKRPLDPLFNHFRLASFLFSIKLYPVKSEKNSDSSEFFSDFKKAFNFYNSFFLSKLFSLQFFSFSFSYFLVSIFFLPIKFIIFIFFIVFNSIIFPFKIIFGSTKNQKNGQIFLFFLLLFHPFFNLKTFNSKRIYFLYRKQFSSDCKTRTTLTSFLFHFSIFIISKTFLALCSETNKKRKFFYLIYRFSRFFIHKSFIILF